MIIILPLLFLDFISYAIFHQAIIFSLLDYIIAKAILSDTAMNGTLYAALMAFLLFDFVLYERFGLGLLLIAPLLIIIVKCKRTLLHASPILLIFCLAGYFLAENLVIYPNVLHLQSNILMTALKFFVNLGLGYTMLLRMQGNRSLAITARGRKVWTPNRMDASRGA